MSPSTPAPDHYVIQFLLLGVPVLIFMLVMGILAVRRRWKAAGIIIGAVFLLTAGHLLKAGRHRTAPRDVVIVQGAGLGSGIAGLLLIILVIRRSKAGPPAGPA